MPSTADFTTEISYECHVVWKAAVAAHSAISPQPGFSGIPLLTSSRT
jgi:hypothetical protein